jgi:predicted membrane metal-binding protein
VIGRVHVLICRWVSRALGTPWNNLFRNFGVGSGHCLCRCLKFRLPCSLQKKVKVLVHCFLFSVEKTCDLRAAKAMPRVSSSLLSTYRNLIFLRCQCPQLGHVLKPIMTTSSSSTG